MVKERSVFAFTIMTLLKRLFICSIKYYTMCFHYLSSQTGVLGKGGRGACSKHLISLSLFSGSAKLHLEKPGCPSDGAGMGRYTCIFFSEERKAILVASQ